MVSRMPLIKRYLKDCDNLEFRIQNYELQIADCPSSDVRSL